ncbi:Uncharacterised protein [Bordetella pertussis]|nr:Uncharacterised protein [Bordetella pertussis]CFU81766.1 Uncharacterised protein [Bordetella pertussis]CPL09343.1 Uncharacterised protein [Bordetella pertussis]CPM60883.1 Uncharacterised protein [Bordetella pertussis]CPN39106.1 Uncharacterised protein [Bordetella pertussis]
MRAPRVAIMPSLRSRLTLMLSRPWPENSRYFASAWGSVNTHASDEPILRACPSFSSCPITTAVGSAVKCSACS